ncbi:MAG TPA: EamA family transporter [Candidatus Anoxymicrobiaceae bacterium]
MKTVAGILIAIASALLFNHAVYRMKISVEVLPRIEMSSSWGVVKTFITNWPWLSAQIENIAGFILYAVALSIIPVSIVEPITAAGIVLLVYLAIRQLGEKVRPRDYAAIGMTVLGVILISLSLERGVSEAAPNYHLFWIIAAVILGVAIAAPLLMGRKSTSVLAVALAVSGGLLDGIAGVFTRLVMINWGNDWKSTLVLLIVCVLAYVSAFIILQAGLQRGKAIVVAPVYNGIMELVPIVVGIVALNESFPTVNGKTDIFLSAMRILAFALILVGTLMLASRPEEAKGDEVNRVSGDTTVEEPTG